jgi:ATP-dependent protease ClpP protease subunit
MKSWLKTLAAAVIGGSVTSGTAVLQNRLQFGAAAPPITGETLGLAAGMGALIAAVTYIMKSPFAAPQQSEPNNPKPTATE